MLTDLAERRTGLDEHETALLIEAVRTVDLLDELDAEVKRAGAVVDSPQGRRANPAAVEARQQRIALARIFAALRLPSGEEGMAGRPQRRGRLRRTTGQLEHTLLQPVDLFGVHASETNHPAEGLIEVGRHRHRSSASPDERHRHRTRQQATDLSHLTADFLHVRVRRRRERRRGRFGALHRVDVLIDVRDQSLEDQLVGLGLNREQVDAYVRSLGLTPSNVTTAIDLANDEATKERIQGILDQMAGVDAGAEAEIQAAIDRGAFAEAERMLNNLQHDRPINFIPTIVGGRGGSVGGRMNRPKVATSTGRWCRPSAKAAARRWCSR